MNQQQKAQEKKIANQAIFFCCSFLTICCYNAPTLFHSRFSAIKRLIFILRIIREAVTVNNQSLLKPQIILVFFFLQNNWRGGRPCSVGQSLT